MNNKIDLILLLIIVIISSYFYYGNIREDFAAAASSSLQLTPPLDDSSNRNLAGIANKLMTPDGLSVPGNVNFIGMSKVKGTEILPIGSIVAYSSNKYTNIESFENTSDTIIENFEGSSVRPYIPPRRPYIPPRPPYIPPRPPPPPRLPLQVQAVSACSDLPDAITPQGGTVLNRNDAPPGWLWCDGTTFSNTDYPVLANILLTAGTPNYGLTKLPDLRGRAIIGAGPGNGLKNRSLGEMGGAETHTLIECQIPSHSHSLDNRSHYHTISQARNHLTGNNRCCGGQGNTLYEIEGALTGPAGNHNHTMTAQGKNAHHNNMQPFLGLNYIIRAK